MREMGTPLRKKRRAHLAHMSRKEIEDSSQGGSALGLVPVPRLPFVRRRPGLRARSPASLGRERTVAIPWSRDRAVVLGLVEERSAGTIQGREWLLAIARGQE